MKTPGSTYFKRLVAPLAGLLLCNLLLFATVTVWLMHTHQLPDGRLVVHCHPTAPEEREDHEHSRSDYVLIDHAVRSEAVVEPISPPDILAAIRPEGTPPTHAGVGIPTGPVRPWSDRAPPESPAV